MNPEKVIVVYFSRTGKTKAIAREISNKLGCAIEEIKTPVSYSGFLGYQMAAIQATFGMTPEIKSLQSNLNDFDLVILGGPVWAGGICGPLRSFIQNYKKDFKNVAFIATQRGNSGRLRIFDKLKVSTGRPPLAALSVTERDFKSGLYRNNISAFLNKLSLSNPKIGRRRIAAREEAETNF